MSENPVENALLDGLKETIENGLRLTLAKQVTDRTLTGYERDWITDGWVPATLKVEYINADEVQG